MKKKTRTGIITIVRVNNYGAELQAFALQAFLNKEGYDAEIIDYLFCKNNKHKKEKQSKPFFKFPFKRVVKEFIFKEYNKVANLLFFRRYKRRNNAFDAFHNKFTRFSVEQYKSYSQLYSNPPIYDVYCVGSDQVWNPYNYTSLYPYFLTFAPEGKKKISYASSFGVSHIPKEVINIYSDCLKTFNHLSVRESTGSEFVHTLIGMRPPVVLDPTFLLNKKDWDSVASDKYNNERPYILLYILKESKFIEKESIRLSQELNLNIIRIRKNAIGLDNRNKKIKDVWDASPSDFISLFKNSRLVLTNSFHGTVFSIIMERNFYTILPKENERNSRQVDLLNSLGLTDNLVYEGNQLLPTTINFSEVSEKMNSMRNESINYLLESIES